LLEIRSLDSDGVVSDRQQRRRIGPAAVGCQRPDGGVLISLADRHLRPGHGRAIAVSDQADYASGNLLSKHASRKNRRQQEREYKTKPFTTQYEPHVFSPSISLQVLLKTLLTLFTP